MQEITKIENYSISKKAIKKIHRNTSILKRSNYRVLNLAVGGDAPKDFIQAYIYGDSKKVKLSKWSKYIAKVGHKWYPLESISEHLLNRIGEVLDLNMAKSHIVKVDNQIRLGC